MATVFMDSSALARRYFVREPGAGRVKALLSGPDPVLASHLVSVEFASALARRVREGEIDEAERTRIWLAFQARLRADVKLMAIDRAVLDGAERLHSAHSLRALDSIHVASARIASQLLAGAGEPMVFLTADHRQAAAAEAARLAVERLI